MIHDTWQLWYLAMCTSLGIETFTLTYLHCHIKATSSYNLILPPDFRTRSSIFWLCVCVVMNIFLSLLNRPIKCRSLTDIWEWHLFKHLHLSVMYQHPGDQITKVFISYKWTDIYSYCVDMLLLYCQIFSCQMTCFTL